MLTTRPTTDTIELMNFFAIRLLTGSVCNKDSKLVIEPGHYQRDDAAVFADWRLHGLLDIAYIATSDAGREKLTALDNLKPEQGRTVLEIPPNDTHVGFMTEVWRLPDFTKTKVYWDFLNKELVRVLNSVCILDHSSLKARADSHALSMNHCLYVPSAVQCHRCQYEPKTKDFVIHAITRTVNPAYLRLPKQEVPEELLLSVPRMRGVVVGFPFSEL